MKLFIFIDALGWELVKRHHFCEDFLPFRYRVETQLGYSAGALPTILTGKPPQEHGHFSFFTFSEKSPFHWMRFLPHFLMPHALFSNRRIRNPLSKFLKKCYGYTGYFQLYAIPFKKLPQLDYSEKKDIFIPGGLPCPNLADIWSSQKEPFHISNWRLGDTANIRIMKELIAGQKIEKGFLYTASLDGFLHKHIEDDGAICTELKRWEQDMRELFDVLLKSDPEAEACIFSDHGMTPLKTIFDSASLLKKLKAKPFRDYLVLADSTMIRFHFLNPNAEKEIRQTFRTLPHGEILDTEKRIRFGVNFPDNRYGDMIYLLNPGVQAAPSDMGSKPLPGMHGYTPEDKDSDACCLSNHPLVPPPRHLSDYFKLMT